MMLTEYESAKITHNAESAIFAVLYFLNATKQKRRIVHGMPNIASVLKQEIARLARKEIRGDIRAVRAASARYRKDLAKLKRDVASLEGELTRVRKANGANGAQQPAQEDSARVRFSAKGLRSHREKLGLSAGDYGKLLGVSAQTIYKWEKGSARPRKRQVTALASVRTLGKKQAAQHLNDKASESPARAIKRPRPGAQATRVSPHRARRGRKSTTRRG